MEHIKQFLDDLFILEQQAINARNHKAQFDRYNQLAAQIKEKMASITVGLGLPVWRKMKPDSFYTEDANFSNKRNLYKISEYSHSKYGQLWACYTSLGNPRNRSVMSMSEMLIISLVNEELKMIAVFSHDHDTDKWVKVGGVDDLNPYNFGELIQIERLLAPKLDEWSIAEYEANR